MFESVQALLAEHAELQEELGDPALHADAAQSAGKVPIDVAASGVALLSFCAHKLGGPKGAGALYLRRRPRPALQPLQFGGGHERGLRSGTLYPLLIRMSEQGLVEAEWRQPAHGGRPPRHAYRLTAAGLAVERASAREDSGAALKALPA